MAGEKSRVRAVGAEEQRRAAAKRAAVRRKLDALGSELATLTTLAETAMPGGTFKNRHAEFAKYGLGDGHTSPGLPGAHPEEAAGLASGGELKPNDANESESNVLGNVLAAYPKLDQFFR